VIRKNQVMRAEQATWPRIRLILMVAATITPVASGAHVAEVGSVNSSTVAAR
jgi:hypothetical protein